MKKSTLQSSSYDILGQQDIHQSRHSMYSPTNEMSVTARGRSPSVQQSERMLPDVRRKSIYTNESDMHRRKSIYMNEGQLPDLQPRRSINTDERVSPDMSRRKSIYSAGRISPEASRRISMQSEAGNRQSADMFRRASVMSHRINSAVQNIDKPPLRQRNPKLSFQMFGRMAALGSSNQPVYDLGTQKTKTHLTFKLVATAMRQFILQQNILSRGIARGFYVKKYNFDWRNFKTYLQKTKALEKPQSATKIYELSAPAAPRPASSHALEDARYNRQVPSPGYEDYQEPVSGQQRRDHYQMQQQQQLHSRSFESISSGQEEGHYGQYLDVNQGRHPHSRSVDIAPYSHSRSFDRASPDHGRGQYGNEPYRDGPSPPMDRRAMYQSARNSMPPRSRDASPNRRVSYVGQSEHSQMRSREVSPSRRPLQPGSMRGGASPRRHQFGGQYDNRRQEAFIRGQSSHRSHKSELEYDNYHDPGTDTGYWEGDSDAYDRSEGYYHDDRRSRSRHKSPNRSPHRSPQRQPSSRRGSRYDKYQDSDDDRFDRFQDSSPESRVRTPDLDLPNPSPRSAGMTLREYNKIAAQIQDSKRQHKLAEVYRDRPPQDEAAITALQNYAPILRNMALAEAIEVEGLWWILSLMYTCCKITACR